MSTLPFLCRCYWYIGIYMVCCHQLMFKVAQAVLSLSASYRSGVAYKYFWRLLCVKGNLQLGMPYGDLCVCSLPI
jgi:hypothetical protein